VKDIERKLAIGHIMAHAPQCVIHGLHLAAMVGHVEFSLHEHVKLCLELGEGYESHADQETGSRW
jgi:hypothetical protein